MNEHGAAPANRILAALPQDELERLRPHLTRVRLVAGQRLIESGQAAEHVFFIVEGMASMLAAPDDRIAAVAGEAAPGQAPKQASGDAAPEPDPTERNLTVQVAMIGREGMVGGLALLDGSSAAFSSVVMQVPGPALRIPTAELRQCLGTCPVLRESCLRFVQSLTRQIMANAASNARGTLTERCMRWLLMAHERMDGDDLPVTHEALSAMLGVRRSGVTVATAALQKAGLITTSRGRIRVLNRPGLVAAVGRSATTDAKENARS